MKILLWTDNKFASFWSKILTLLCSATGQSNFFFCRFALAISACSLTGYCLADTIVTDQSVLSTLLTLLLPILPLYIIVTAWRKSRQLEAIPLDFTSALDLDEWDWIFHIRLGLSVSGSIVILSATINLEAPLAALPISTTAAALYFLLDLHPSRKALFAMPPKPPDTN